MLIVWVNVDLYMAFKQILFSIGFFKTSFFLFFFFNLGDKKNRFLFSFFNIQKSSVSPFGSVDTLYIYIFVWVLWKVNIYMMLDHACPLLLCTHVCICLHPAPGRDWQGWYVEETQSAPGILQFIVCTRYLTRLAPGTIHNQYQVCNTRYCTFSATGTEQCSPGTVHSVHQVLCLVCN